MRLKTTQRLQSRIGLLADGGVLTEPVASRIVDRHERARDCREGFVSNRDAASVEAGRNLAVQLPGLLAKYICVREQRREIEAAAGSVLKRAELVGEIARVFGVI